VRIECAKGGELVAQGTKVLTYEGNKKRKKKKCLVVLHHEGSRES